MGEYKKMVESAVKIGKGEKAMWRAVEVADNLLDKLHDEHPEEFDKYMRRMSEAVNGCHYTEELAKKDVEQMHHTGKDGMAHHGSHWSAEEIEAATNGKQFPQGTTKWDKFVAYNAAWHDFNKKFDDAQVLDIAYLFFFGDEDYEGDGKVWKYMSEK